MKPYDVLFAKKCWVLIFVDVENCTNLSIIIRPGRKILNVMFFVFFPKRKWSFIETVQHILVDLVIERVAHNRRWNLAGE